MWQQEYYKYWEGYVFTLHIYYKLNLRVDIGLGWLNANSSNIVDLVASPRPVSSISPASLLTTSPATLAQGLGESNLFL